MSISKSEKQALISQFGLNSQDTGSVEVQIALLTQKIRFLTDHVTKNPKDYSSKLGQLKMVCDRRSLLAYLARRKKQAYSDLIKKLGLRK